MSIRKRLILTNIGMIVIPIICFFIVEILLVYTLIIWKGEFSESELNLFIPIRSFILVFVFALTNGLLTYFVAKSILSPIKKLSIAAGKISAGDLDYSIQSNKKDELGQLTNTFEVMRIKLKEAQAAQLQYEQNRQELIASISHDLKTPLTSIKGYVSGIQDGVANTPEKLERYMNIIQKTANEMDELIDELFLYSKLDLDQVSFHLETIDLRAFFSDFIEELNFNLQTMHGSATLSANREDSFFVQADRDKLRRAVTNIVQNSLKYLDKDKKEITVHLYSNLNDVTVEMRDNGSGIHSDDLPYIFDSFYRTDASRNSSTGGSGLGLSIVRKMIEGQGGTVWAESECGKGTSIYFKLKKVT